MNSRKNRTLPTPRRTGKHPVLPWLWFFTGEERGIDVRSVIAAVERLPRGAGVIFRDYRMADRASLARALAHLCHRKHLIFLVAGDPTLARIVGADGIHIPRWAVPRRGGARIVTLSVHGARDARRGQTAGADLLIVSPAFATPTHPEAVPLGPVRLGLLAKTLPAPAAALGGITERNARRLRGLPLKALCATGLGMRGLRLPAGNRRR